MVHALGTSEMRQHHDLGALSRASLAMVGSTRSMRVASATPPASIGTLKSTRTSTRLPSTSTPSMDLMRERSRPPAPALPGALSDRRGQLVHISRPMAAAVSYMRLEKPHSLSYQDTTRQNVPSTTWVP